MRVLNSTKSYGSLLLFIFWPFLAVFDAFRNYKSEQSKNVIWLFVIYFGSTFVFAKDSDSTRYYEDLEILAKIEGYSIIGFFLDTISVRIDFVQPVLTFLVSRFSTDGNVLFSFFGLIYGYFYSRNIWILIDRAAVRIRPEALGFLLYFAFLSTFANINGFRYWTGLQVFVFGILNYFLLERKTKGILFILSSVFFHDTLIIAISITISFILIPLRNIYFYILLYFISLGFSQLSSTIISDTMDAFLGTVRDRQGYLNEEYAEEYFALKENVNWYVKYKYLFSDLLLGGSILFLTIRRKLFLTNNKIVEPLVCLGLTMVSFTNLVNYIPSMARFYYLGYFPIAIAFFVFFQDYYMGRRPEWYKITVLVIMLIFSFTEFWSTLNYTSFEALFGNPFTAYLTKSNTSIYLLIKSIF
ncbi:hypothetical protein MASR2M44_13900 [Bacteroidota bacterium]